MKPDPRFGGNIPIIGGNPRNPMNRPAQIRDFLGRVIHEGDGLTLHTPNAQIWKVQRIQPVLSGDGVPPGMMEITITCVAKFFAERDVKNTEFVRVVEATELPGEHKPAEEPPAEPRDAAEIEEPPQ